ncbi:lipoprotein-anchoring transpeptidase ErfK/SrfK [Beijerinckia sp. GAS462]|nr:lipoprotein-anchoring transpeptidase ErfK/SrfK [Beijerinckia sp. GAS462]SEB50987.1 Tat (twin-arginine translocation) pathway signal sequence [Beijerinckia sp. 28-YEA-48]
MHHCIELGAIVHPVQSTLSGLPFFSHGWPVTTGFGVMVGLVSSALSRRGFLQLGGGVAAVAAFATPALAARDVVPFPAEYPPGTMVISLRQRKLFLVVGDGQAIRYPVAVGKAGKAWSGWAHVEGKFVNPDWAPPAVVKHDNPRIPDLIPGGAPNNPMGPRAITLDRSEIAIHGTTRTMRGSVGSAASYGCIRMYNEDVIDLFDRVRVGMPVVAI